MASRVRRLRVLAVATALAVAVAPALVPAAAQAQPAAAPNAVVTWHSHAQTAIHEVGGQTAATAARSFAMVQGAVYDAVNSIAGTPYEPYLAAPPSRPGDSAPAAVAAAAHHVLLALFPAQADSLRTRYEEALAAVPDGRSKTGGIAVGEAAAATMIEARRDDGAFSGATWPVGDQPGQWRPTPPGFLQVGAWFATLRPFAADPAEHRTAGPPALGSRAYARELNEVKSLGSATSTTRTPEQTEAAIWWDDATMVEWEIRRQLATTHRLTTLQAARMFAMTDVAVADALIACYQQKRRWSFWRPVTAIPLADTDGNPGTAADPGWAPLRTTAPSPEWPSGHACYTSAALRGLRAFFGRDAVPFSAFSPQSGTTRHYATFSAAIAELNEARIWAGVHYRGATVQGDRLGAAVTRDVLAREFGRSHR